MLCLYMHSERQLLIAQSLKCNNDLGNNILDEKHYMHDNKMIRDKKVSFDPFTHAGTMIHQQSDFTWNIFDNVLTRLLRSMASTITQLPQDPRAKKSSAVVFTTFDNNSSKSLRSTVTTPTSIISSNINNKQRTTMTHKQQHRHQCWQPINNNTASSQQHNNALPAWMFTHKHVRDIRSNSDGLRKLAVKVEMARHKKLKISRVKTEHKRYLTSRNDGFVPCKKSTLSQQLL